MSNDKGYLKCRLEELGYQVYEKLGQGAQASVYLVQYEGALTACKVSEEKEVLAREGEVLKQIHHPGIPYFIKYSECDWGAVLLMEYVKGNNMREYLGLSETLRISRVLDWGMELAETLCALHDMEGTVIYRDLKPENIIVRQDGHLKLVDMGCACTKRQATFSMGGTPGYAAPEQLKKQGKLSERSDVYAWGMVMSEIIGCCKNRSVREYLWSKKVKRIIRRCISKSICSRPIGMRQVIEELSVQKLRKNLQKIEAKKHKS